MIYTLAGIAAGILAGMFGIGGGVIIVPSLLFIAKMEPHRAIGTSLAALLLPVGALGAWEYYRRGAVDVRAGALLAVGVFVGALIGAKLGLQLPGRSLQRAFAIFLFLVSLELWRSA